MPGGHQPVETVDLKFNYLSFMVTWMLLYLNGSFHLSIYNTHRRYLLYSYWLMSEGCTDGNSQPTKTEAIRRKIRCLTWYFSTLSSYSFVSAVSPFWSVSTAEKSPDILFSDAWSRQAATRSERKRYTIDRLVTSNEKCDYIGLNILFHGCLYGTHTVWFFFFLWSFICMKISS